jgi:hypothetical protein
VLSKRRRRDGLLRGLFLLRRSASLAINHCQHRQHIATFHTSSHHLPKHGDVPKLCKVPQDSPSGPAISALNGEPGQWQRLGLPKTSLQYRSIHASTDSQTCASYSWIQLQMRNSDRGPQGYESSSLALQTLLSDFQINSCSSSMAH